MPQADGMSGPAAGSTLRPGGNRSAASRSRHLPRMAFIIVIVIAAMASVAFGVVLVADAREFLAHHRATGGVVTAVSARTTCAQGGCSTDYDWTVRYQPPGSRSLTFTGGGNPNSTPVGTHVPVYYLVSDPRDAMLDPGTGEQHGGIVFIAAGLVGFAIGYGNYRALSPGRRP
jgi:Protein of unknown function (DUF3592)